MLVISLRCETCPDLLQQFIKMADIEKETDDVRMDIHDAREVIDNISRY